jgi:allophanate hydrolase subunit 1
MIGFAPGFLYLGPPDPAIQTGRRAEPRSRTPPRSVSIGGAQAGVSPPFEVPSGWHLLGQTAVRTYRPERDAAPFPFKPGDSIRFHAVPEEEYHRQCQAADAGDPVAWAERSDG